MAALGKILIIDDDSGLRLTTKRILSSVGYEIQEGENGAQALQLAKEFQPDIILLDVNLPDMSGFEVCWKIKSTDELKGILVVMLTASSTDADSRADGLESGADGYLTRPVSSRELVAYVQAFLRIRSAEKSKREAEYDIRWLYEAMTEMVVFHELVFDEHGKAIDYRILDINSVFEEMTGIDRKQAIGELGSKLYGTGEAPFLEQYQKVAETGEPIRFEAGFEPLKKIFSIAVHSSGVGRFTTVTTDITSSKQSELEMQKQLTQSEQSRRAMLSIMEDLKEIELEFRKRNEELTRLYRASGTLLSGAALDQAGIGKNIVNALTEEFGEANCCVLLVNKSKQTLEVIALGGPFAIQNDPRSIPLNGIGLIAEAARTKKQINIGDVQKVSNYLPYWKEAHSEMDIPLMIGTQVIGVMDVQSAELNAFDENDERLMTIFAERAALALEHARLFAQTETRMKRLDSLRSIDQAISGALDLKLTLGIVLEQTLSQLEFTSADIFILDSSKQLLHPAASKGLNLKKLEEDHIRIGKGITGRVALDRQLVVLNDPNLILTNADLKTRFRDEGISSYVGLPLITKGQVMGVMEVFNRFHKELGEEEKTYLEMLAGQAAIAIDAAQVYEELQTSNTELLVAYDETIEGWSRAMDLRDEETEGHTRRVTTITMQMAEGKGFSQQDMISIRRGALLHDIGKMGVPDHILRKPGPLTKKERALIEEHPKMAYAMLKPISYLQSALEIPYCHHEKWDGSGYPRGLKGEEIPLAARIFSLVDVWDALTSDRPYRKAWTKEKTIEYLREESGKYFDPSLVEQFIELVNKE